MDSNAGFWIIALVVVFFLLAVRARWRKEPMPWIHILFFCSGFPALIYQIVWQRALFAIYGLNIQSVTIVVSAFMLGLGLGSLAGGALSKNARLPPVALFALAELGTAGFGLVSLKLFRWIAEFTAGSSPAMTALAAFSLIVVPTLLMGATLPLLVEYLVRSSRNIGSSVGGLYFANTLGSGVACFVAADVLMRLLGQSGSIQFSASINALVGAGALVYAFRSKRDKEEMSRPEQPMELNVNPSKGRLLPFPLALACAAFCGFAALAYEILWYRLLTFATGDTARVFASLLGSYLLGLALGSRFVERYSDRQQNRGDGVNLLGGVFFASAILGFAVGPVVALVMNFVPLANAGIATAYLIVLLSICLGALFFWCDLSAHRARVGQPRKTCRRCNEFPLCGQHCRLDSRQLLGWFHLDGLSFLVFDFVAASGRRRCVCGCCAGHEWKIDRKIENGDGIWHIYCVTGCGRQPPDI